MGLESATYINGLVATNPTGTDPKSQGDDHIRLIKAATLATWANVTGAVLASHTQMNYLVGVTSAIQTQLDAKGAIAGQAWTGAHDYTGGTLTVATQSQGDNSTKAASTAYVDAGLALKGALSGATWTGTHDFTGSTISVPTATTGDNSTKPASTAFVQNTAFASALPNQSGNSGKILTTDGTNASWTTQPGWTLIASATPLSSDATIAFTSISTTYQDHLIVFENVNAGGSSNSVMLALGDATPTYSSAVQVSVATISSSSPAVGGILIVNAKKDYGTLIQSIGAGALTSPSIINSVSAFPSTGWRVTGGVRAIRVSFSTNNFGGSGTIRVYGRV